MDISVDAKVHCTDGDAGHVTCVIINPVTDEITHVVVYDAKFLGVERIVPIKAVSQSTPEIINLNCKRSDLYDYDTFIGVDYDFLEREMPYMYGTAAYWPMAELDGYGELDEMQMMAEYEKVPPGELLVRRGAAVYAKDEKIGHVHEFIADPQTGHITHLVLTRGHLWGRRDVVIPLSEINSYGDERVTLKIDKEAVGKLPELTIKR